MHVYIVLCCVLEKPTQINDCFDMGENVNKMQNKPPFVFEGGLMRKITIVTSSIKKQETYLLTAGENH